VCEMDREEAAMADASPFQGVHLHHVARETSDVNRMVEFYQKVCILGLQNVMYGEFSCDICNLRMFHISNFVLRVDSFLLQLGCDL